MAVGLNQVVVSGTIANQVSVTTTQNGVSVAHFTLMSERAGKNGVVKLYVPVTAWGTVADAVRHLGYGQGATVLGRLSLGRRKDRQTGTERAELEVIAEMVMAGETDAIPASHGAQGYGAQYPQAQQRPIGGGEFGARYVPDEY